jgi:hypothetical protein
VPPSRARPPGWFVTLVAEFAMPAAKVSIRQEQAVGFDRVLEPPNFLVGSDGGAVRAPRHYRARERKLRRAQRHLSRARQGSRNREKARRRVAQPDAGAHSRGEPGVRERIRRHARESETGETAERGGGVLLPVRRTGAENASAAARELSYPTPNGRVMSVKAQLNGADLAFDAPVKLLQTGLCENRGTYMTFRRMASGFWSTPPWNGRFPSTSWSSPTGPRN